MSQALPFTALFDGYDAGYYSLPAEVIKARDTHAAIVAQPYPEPPESVVAVIERLAVETVDAVHAGTELPDVAQIGAARAAELQHQDVSVMLGYCKDIAVKRVQSAVHAHGLAAITDHLKPAHDETWQSFRRAWQTLLEHGQTEPRHLLAAPAKVRKASDTCDQLAERYVAIHTARGALARAGFTCPDDPNGKYVAIRNYHQLSPSRMAMARPPWFGLNTRQFLGWHATNGGQLWLPAPDEQKQAVWDEVADNPVKRAAGF
ncbi:hypothetical protein AB0J57_05065 [Streptomyces sp. NPDC049837]|uniref:hypothetical protein n=1 Tax=Streptomyces sp. NPDC049837 TaxID=3155277 RepID=UPI003436A296